MIGTLASYLPLLLATLALESVIARALARSRHLPRAIGWRTVRVCIAANLLTHPIVTLVSWSDPRFWLPAEALALLVELLVYLRIVPLPPARAALIALCSNLVTGALSLILSLG